MKTDDRENVIESLTCCTYKRSSQLAKYFLVVLHYIRVHFFEDVLTILPFDAEDFYLCKSSLLNIIIQKNRNPSCEMNFTNAKCYMENENIDLLFILLLLFS